MPEVMIPGPVGRLHALYYPSVHSQEAPAALLLPPNPHRGGTMESKVLYAVYQALLARGFAVLRFNFRGVGRSEVRPNSAIQVNHSGDNNKDFSSAYIDDAAAAFSWLQQTNREASEFWVGGFSFGAWIGMQLLMRRPEITHFVAVSPPANLYNFDFLAPCPHSGVIVQGDNDGIVKKASVDTLVQKIQTQHNVNIDYRVIEGADHSFNQYTQQLQEQITEHIDAVFAARQYKQAVNL